MSSLVYTFFSRSGRVTLRADVVLGAGFAVDAGVVLIAEVSVGAGFAGLSSPEANAGMAISEQSIAASKAWKSERVRILLRMDVPPSLSPGIIARPRNRCKRGLITGPPRAKTSPLASRRQGSIDRFAGLAVIFNEIEKTGKEDT
jgi:hypothetical protein